ncbi:MAG: DegT/DnrJ/EryC1/StrS family aminotransferase [Nanobdellota archaeon]
MEKVNLLYLTFSILGCYLGALALAFEKEKSSAKNTLIQEYNAIFSTKIEKMDKKRAIALFFLLFISLGGITKLFLIIPIVLLFVIILQKDAEIYMKYIIRYLLEIPKVFFIYLAFNVPVSPFWALFIVSMGSFFYHIVHRGIGLQEIFLFILNYLIGIDLVTNLLIVLALRLIGIIFFILPIHFLTAGTIKKYPRQTIPFNLLIRPTKKETLRTNIKKTLGLNHESKIVFFESGRDSLYTALKALKDKYEEKYKVENKNEVIVPAFNFELIGNIVKKAGLIPIFADIEKNSFNINPKEAEKKISKNTLAIITTHMLGNPCEMDKLKKLKNKYGLYIIEDCAHTVGSKYKNRVCGTFGDISAFSLHPAKTFHGLCGGFLLINNTEEFSNLINESKKEMSIIKEFKYLIKNNLEATMLNQPLFSIIFWYVIFFIKILGIDLLDKASKTDPDYSPKNINKTIGSLNAGLINKNLKKLKERNKKKVMIKNTYQKILKENTQTFSNNSCYPLYLGYRSHDMESLRQNLFLKGIDTKAHYMRNIGGESCKIAHSLEKKLIYLPFYYNLKKKDIQHISRLVKENGDM